MFLYFLSLLGYKNSISNILQRATRDSEMTQYGYNFKTYTTPAYDVSPDYVSKPVIGDPVLAYGPVRTMTDYKTKLDEYGIGGVEHKWRRPTSPTRDYYRPQASEDFNTSSRFGGEEKWKPVRDSYRPRKVEEFITTVQNEASRPIYGASGSTHWRQSPNTTELGFYNNSDSYNYNATPTKANNSALSKPTNSINEALQILTEAANPVGSTSAYSRYNKVDPIFTGSVDRKDAEWRYGKPKFAPRHYTDDELSAARW